MSYQEQLPHGTPETPWQPCSQSSSTDNKDMSNVRNRNVCFRHITDSLIEYRLIRVAKYIQSAGNFPCKLAEIIKEINRNFTLLMGAFSLDLV